MTTAWAVKTSVTVTNSSFQNYTHPDNHTRQTTDTPGFKPFTVSAYLHWHPLQPWTIVISCKAGQWENTQLLLHYTPPTAWLCLWVLQTLRRRSPSHGLNPWWRPRVWTWCSQRFSNGGTLCHSHGSFSIWRSICWYLKLNVSWHTGLCLCSRLAFTSAGEEHSIFVNNAIPGITLASISGIFIDDTIPWMTLGSMLLASLLRCSFWASTTLAHTFFRVNFQWPVIALVRRPHIRVSATLLFSSQLNLHNICWGPSSGFSSTNTTVTVDITHGRQFNVLWFRHLSTSSSRPSLMLPRHWGTSQLC